MIRVAIIGAGIGREHLAAYRTLADKFTVVAVCDLDLDRAQEIVVDDPIAVTGDFNAVLQDPAIDLIDICLPPHLHFRTATQALEAGKHVICEKPLVTCLQEAEALLATEADAAGTLYPVFQYRYGRAMAQLHALEAAGLTGTPYTAALETHWARREDYYAIPWRGTWAGENGGAVLGHAIHNHDLIAHLMGAPQRVFAITDTRVNDIETEDCAAITMHTDRGALVTSSITLGAATDTTRMRLCYQHLTATSDDTPYAPMSGRWTFVARDPAQQDAVDRVVAAVPETQGEFRGFLAAIAADLSGATASVVTSADGRRSIELVTAVYASARTGEAVDLPLSRDHPLYSGWAPALSQI